MSSLGEAAGRWLRPLAVVALLAGLAGVVIGRGRDRFEGRVVSRSDERAHVVYRSEPFWLQFTDRERSGTAYEVDYRRGSTTRRYRGRTGRRGEPSRILVRYPHPAPRVLVEWRVGGEVRARWGIVIRRLRKLQV